jgi:hypothetical protein
LVEYIEMERWPRWQETFCSMGIRWNIYKST